MSQTPNLLFRPSRFDANGFHFNSKNLTGERFGNLTATKLAPKDKQGQNRWFCACDCGNEVEASMTSLTKGRFTICQECVTNALAIVLTREQSVIAREKVSGVKVLPSKSFLEECLDYQESSGELRWRRRPMNHFTQEMVWKMWLAHYEGKIAGKPMTRRGGKPHAVAVKLSIGDNNFSFVAHRIIGVLLDIEVPDGYQIDHHDRNPFNNRRKNLRIATPEENCGNSAARKDYGKKGVNPLQSGRFQAALCGVSLGVFDTEKEAHAAYCEAGIKKWGEFFYAG